MKSSMSVALGVRGRRWAVEIGDPPNERVALTLDVLMGGHDTYPTCQEAVRAIRGRGVHRV